MKYRLFGLLLSLAMLQGCAVAGAAVGVTKAAVKTAGSVTGAVVKTSAKAGGAVVAVVAGSSNEPEDEAVQLSAPVFDQLPGPGILAGVPPANTARVVIAPTTLRPVALPQQVHPVPLSHRAHRG